MVTKTQTLPGAEGFIVSEGNGAISREAITVYENKIVYAGTVLGKVAASGQYVEYQGEATDGSEAAVAICCREIDCTTGPQEVAAIVRYAEVRKSDLKWRDGMTDQQKTDAYADLLAVGIIARDGPLTASTETQTY